MLETKYFFRVICLADTYCLFEVSGRIYTIISLHLAEFWWPCVVVVCYCGKSSLITAVKSYHVFKINS